MRLALLCALGVLLAAPVHAQYPADSVAGPILEPAPAEEANQSADPNRVPYETETHVGHHLLALPATVWSGVASVFREGVLWAEHSGTIERLQRRFGGPEPPRFGVVPELNVGGQDGVVFGGSVFYNDLFGTGRRIRVGGRYGFSGTYSITGRFRDPSLFGSGLRFGLHGGYYDDTQERLYFGGNDASEEDFVDYAFRRTSGRASITVPLPRHLSLVAEGAYTHMNVRNGDGLFPTASVAGFGAADLLSGGANLVLDLSETGGLHAPRRFQGTIVLLSYHYGHDVSGRNFAFHRVGAEVRQFVPVPFLAFDRRLALRARLEKTHPPDGSTVPFYEASRLGGIHTLRGYATDRFRDEGTLLLNAEYRWPVWDLLDAVLFFDTGQVFHRYDDIAPSDFHSNVGAGLRVYGRSDVAGRLEVAFGPEGPRLLAQIGTVF